MFTGIVAATGEVRAVEFGDGDGRFRFATGELPLAGLRIGDSIAVNGACLTATELHGDGFSADVSRETLACTTLGEFRAGDRVNLERALALGEALGGHLVTGHVDGVGTVTAFAPDGESWRLEVELPPGLRRYVAAKGSITLDGVSLTVNTVSATGCGVMLVPHTRAATIVGDYAPGTRVNVEVDLIARYLERLVQYTDAPSADDDAPRGPSDAA